MIDKSKKLHIIGIGGIGMSSIAEVLHARGYNITGSDMQLSDVTDRLTELGIKVYEGHKAENIGDADLVIHTSAVGMDNPELKSAAENGIEFMKRPAALEILTKEKYCIGIAGIHGKTTTTTMTGLVMIEGGFDPDVIVGGKSAAFGGTNARTGTGKYIVIEADEYDKTFLSLHPNFAILTTLEKEHLDTYKDIEELNNSFIEYANKVPESGYTAACIDDPGVRAILPKLKRNILTYGLTDDADVTAKNIEHSSLYSEFTLVYKGEALGRINLKAPGAYNIRNALAAAAVGLKLNVDFEKIKKALEAFTGVRRRFEVKYDGQVLVIDDYAHHPTEARVTLEGIRSGWDRRLIAVFQPHLYTRTKDFAEDFGKAFQDTDIFICTDIYPAREKPLPGVTGKMVTDSAVKNGHKNTIYLPDKKDVPVELMKLKKKGDIIITMGAGDIWKQGEEFIKLMDSTG